MSDLVEIPDGPGRNSLRPVFSQRGSYCFKHPIVRTKKSYSRDRPSKDAEGIANSADPDKTATLEAF